jgi:threonylcarbamoyladenosine tRNA methylthiotransferase MtaB
LDVVATAKLPKTLQKSSNSMKTFYVETLGCKVNQYESAQVATLLRARGLTPANPAEADLRIVNSCSVTSQAASQSRQATRRLVRLGLPKSQAESNDNFRASESKSAAGSNRRVVVIGCWATSDTEAARKLNGVDAVLTHHDDLAVELDRLLTLWLSDPTVSALTTNTPAITPPPSTVTQIQNKGERSAAGDITAENKPKLTLKVNENPAASRGVRGLPLLDDRQASRQRAFVKIQDGCDAHCTYCIIPSLRPTLWSKPVGSLVDEVQRLVDAGHVEIVLTGIFLGAYGHPTALHRRQADDRAPLANLIESLSEIAGLCRLRLSSMEPGDLTAQLLKALAAAPKVVPHFHLPLQSGSDLILRRMNRQYNRADFLQMVDRIRASFDRPALTTDIIVGFPGEDDAEFEQTVDIAKRSGFIHVHAFPYSPRPGTAAARWTDQFVRGPVVSERITRLTQLASEASVAFRRSFVGERTTVIIERGSMQHAGYHYRHGRSERYFSVLLNGSELLSGQEVAVRIDSIHGAETFGSVLAEVLA